MKISWCIQYKISRSVIFSLLITKLLLDYRPKNLQNIIEPKCCVLYYPIDYPVLTTPRNRSEILHIVWPHRWEFDKNPEAFIQVLLRLKFENHRFRVSVIGESFQEVPEALLQAKVQLAAEIETYGFVQSKDDYYQLLHVCHVVVSTAVHEFFGVAMLEATFCGCFPLVPDRLVYPEIYPKPCLYSTYEELFERLKEYCNNPNMALEHHANLKLDLNKFSCATLLPGYLKLFE